MKKFRSLSIAILFGTFFSTRLFAANLLVEYDEQKEGSYSTQSSNQVQQRLVRDYTILNHKNVNHTLEDIEEVEDELEDNVLNVNRKLITSNNQSFPLLLGAVLQHKKTYKYHQYLITDTGLLSETTQPKAVKKAHKKGFHLIQATSGHVSLQLLEWLQISQDYTVIALYTNRAVCRHCYLIVNSLWKKELETKEKGCLGAAFPLSDKMPNLAQKYINTHLNLSLVQNLIVSMMGYVSKEEMASFAVSMKTTKDEQITMLSNEVKTKDKQITTLKSSLNEKEIKHQKELKMKTQKILSQAYKIEFLKEQIQMLNQEIDKKDNQLNDTNQEVNNYRIYLLKDITAKLNRLQNEFGITLEDIHIENENSVKSFVHKASLQTKEGRRQLDEDMQTLREWHDKYKGDDWKYFDEINRDNAYWSDIYFSIEKKMNQILRNDEKISIFFSVLKSLNTLLSTKKAHLWGLKEALDQNSLKDDNYRFEVARMRRKIQRCKYFSIGVRCWRWII